jgi:phenylalanyl-tRNA synthetase beta chain
MIYILSWIYDHLNLQKKDISKKISLEISRYLSNHVVEIENIEEINLDHENLELIEIKEIKQKEIIGLCKDKKKEISISLREDLKIGNFAITFFDKNKKMYRWANSKDFGGEKETILPKINNNENFEKIISKSDFKFHVSNTAIGHRTDLLCNRGIARELSLFFKTNLIKEDEVFKNLKKIESNNNFFINQKPDDIFFSYIPFLNINERESDLKTSILLSQSNIRAHSFLIDLSNYIMLDIGHPMHIFDAEKVKLPIIGSISKKDQFISLRDGTNMSLHGEDIIFSSKENNILSLAGIAGGKEAAISENTKSIHIEAGCFYPKTIRKSSKNNNIKTESSSRFERGLSPLSTFKAIERCAKIIEDEYKIKLNNEIRYSGNIPEKKIIKVYVKKINEYIGTKIEKKNIEEIFTNLTFIFNQKEDFFDIEIPYFRNDLNIEQDLIEEIARIIGYNNIKLSPIISPVKGFYKRNIYLELKKTILDLFNAHEIYSYGISSIEKSKKIDHIEDENKKLYLKNKYNYDCISLRSSLVTNLFFSLKDKIKRGENKITIFEIAPIWNLEKNEIKERTFLTILFYEKSENKFNFYSKKKIIKELFAIFNIDEIIKFENKNINTPSYYSDLSSNLVFEDNEIGFCGFLNPKIIFNEYGNNGTCFTFEIEVNVFEKVIIKKNNLKNFDISILIENNRKINLIIDELKKDISEISKIEPIDWFKKDEWPDLKSITIRIFYENEIIPGNIYEKCINFFKSKSIKIR